MAEFVIDGTVLTNIINKDIGGHITIPDGITAIGYNAFHGCDAFTSVSIPSSVTVLHVGAFYGCASLQSVIFEGVSTLNTISNSVFQNCANLISLSIPNSVTTIGHGVFSMCTGLRSVTFSSGSNLSSIGAYAFASAIAITSFNVPANVTALGDSSFTNCQALSSFTFSPGINLEAISHNTFSGCISLQSIIIPASVVYIFNNAFYLCTSLSSVTFAAGSNLTTIGPQAFWECPLLTSITLPNASVSIGENAFSVGIVITYDSNGGGDNGGGSDPICFFPQTPILTPSGYVPICQLRAGDAVKTADGRAVKIESVHIQRLQPNAANMPVRIPRGFAGATQTIYVSPTHRIRGPSGFIEAGKQKGLSRRPFTNTLVYYNLRLPCWETDNLVAAGVEAESLAHVERITVTLPQLCALLVKQYGRESLSDEILKKVHKKCKILADGRIMVPVMRH
jgi:hypothetical protein